MCTRALLKALLIKQQRERESGIAKRGLWLSAEESVALLIAGTGRHWGRDSHTRVKG